MHWNVLDLKCNCDTTLYLLKCNVGCCCCTSMHCQYAPQVTTRVLLKLSVYIILETRSVKFYLRFMFQSSWLWNWSSRIFPGRLFSDYFGITWEFCHCWAFRLVWLHLRSKKRKKQFDDYFLFSSFIFGLKFDRGQFGWMDLSKPFCPTHHLTGPPATYHQLHKSQLLLRNTKLHITDTRLFQISFVSRNTSAFVNISRSLGVWNWAGCGLVKVILAIVAPV